MPNNAAASHSKVLLADDDRDQLSIRKLLFEQAGFLPLLALDCEAALRLAALERPACAVVDLCLPDEASGLRLIRQLKAGDAALPIIVLSGKAVQHFDKLPERELVQAIFEKGSASAPMLRQVKSLLKSPKKHPAG